MATVRWSRWASCGALAVWLLAGCGGRLAETPAPAVAPAARAAEITDIQVSGEGDAVRIAVTTSVKAAYSLVRQASPPRLLLEITETGLGALEKVIVVNRGAVSMVKPSSSGANSSVEIYLSGDETYDVETQGTSVVVNVMPKAPPPVAAGETAAAPAAAEPPPAPVAAEPEPEPVLEKAPANLPEAVVLPAPIPPGPRALLAIDVQKQQDGLVVVLQGDAPLAHEYFLVEGKSLVVDIAEAVNKVWPMKRKVDDAWVAQIRIGEHTQPKMATRVVFDLKKVVEYRVESVADRVVVSFGAPALAAAAAKRGGGVVNAVNTVGEVFLRPLDTATRLEIPTSARADFTIVDAGDPAKVVVEIANARIAEKDRKILDLAALNRDVVKVSSFPYTRGDAEFVRVAVQLRRPVPFRATAEGDRVVVDFESAPAAPVAAATARPAAPAPAAAAAIPAPSPVYTGRRLSLDFKDADVNDILRLISEVSGMNFVAGSEVKGTVTIKLADVPWDQALEIILKTNQPPLAQIRESDNIVRITTADKILDEEQRRRRVEEDKKKTVDAQQALEPLVTKSYSISYAKAKDIATVIEKSFSSERGKGLIQSDERTNTLIVQDLAGRIVEIDRIIQSLDTPTPAVLVEARIVEVESNYAKELGVQWNVDGVKDSAHGNATQYAFPNSVSVGGTQAGSDGGNYLVNLPATAATSGIGLSFGHVANTLSLDLRLSAMESLGRTKIISNPKILVVQNQKAVINVGDQLPVTKTDTEGNRTVEWKDVGILLEVTPQVTNDKRVFMEIKIEKSSQGSDVQTTEGTMFSISTKRAETKVLIADGETTVVGGLFTQEEQGSDNTVPGLSRIPLLGWLFKSRSDSTVKKELMIFLTPRLVTM